MRTRLLFALGFVLVVSALIVVRDLGFLGGRERGGPLTLGAGGVSAGVKSGEIEAFGLIGELEGGPVRVQNVRVLVESPDLDVLGPTVSERRLGAGEVGRWPPPWASVPLEDATLKGPVPVALIGLRAKRPGVYYALGLRVDYRRGQRRFRDTESQQLCVTVGRRQRCNLNYRGPHDARVAQVGGPSRYPAAKLTQYRARYTKPDDYTIRLTVANQTRSKIAVSELALDENGLGVQLATSSPVDFTLGAHAFKIVRLHIRFPACRPFGVTFHRLRARLDGELRSIPLSLPLHFGCD